MNSRTQGDIGVAHAIFLYTKMGYKISKPMSDSVRYDLVVDKNGTLYKVECKTTFYKTKCGVPQALLKTCGGNTSWNKIIKKISIEDADILFVSVKGDIAYEIPIKELTCFSTINLGKQYDKYIIS